MAFLMGCFGSSSSHPGAAPSINLSHTSFTNLSKHENAATPILLRHFLVKQILRVYRSHYGFAPRAALANCVFLAEDVISAFARICAFVVRHIR